MSPKSFGPDAILRSKRVVLLDREAVAPAAIHLRGETIAKVSDYDDVPPGCPLFDHGEAVILPGLVDSHVHINEPGRTDWEGFATATKAAAAGGVTTLLDMPLNSLPATTNVESLLLKAQAAAGQMAVDVGLCGGLVLGNASSLRELWQEGVLAVKCFLSDSGVPEFPPVGQEDLELGMRALCQTGIPLLVHAELPGPLSLAEAALRDVDPRRYQSYLQSRPKAAEDQAIELVLRLCRQTEARAHVVHLSSADALLAIKKAKDQDPHGRFTVETCPHYLSFCAEEIPDGATEYKCAPPIREAQNREALWDALRQGLIDQVVSDHSPAPPSLKCTATGDFLKAWGGISSLQLGLSAVFGGALRRSLCPDEDRTLLFVARRMCQGPALLLGLSGRKGTIAPSNDADFCVFDPGSPFVVDPKTLFHRHPVTPYGGQSLQGKVLATYLRGTKIYEAGTHLGPPKGTWLRHTRS